MYTQAVVSRFSKAPLSKELEFTLLLVARIRVSQALCGNPRTCECIDQNHWMPGPSRWWILLERLPVPLQRRPRLADRARRKPDLLGHFEGAESLGQQLSRLPAPFREPAQPVLEVDQEGGMVRGGGSVIVGDPCLQVTFLSGRRQADDAETIGLLGAPVPGIHPTSPAAPVADASAVADVANRIVEDPGRAYLQRVLSPLDQPVPCRPGSGTDVGDGFFSLFGFAGAEGESCDFAELLTVSAIIARASATSTDRQDRWR
jgi:hypothetical protein